MGCASSSPLVEGGKNLVEAAKDTANEAVTKGEKAFQDVTDTAKDGIETVKETVQDAFQSAGNGVDNVMGKIGETFNMATSNAKDKISEIDAAKDEAINNASDATAEAISEAETVLASEVDNAKESISETVDYYNNEIEQKSKDTVNFLNNEINNKVSDLGESIKEMKENAKIGEKLEDVENNFDMLGDNVSKIEDKVEEVLKTSSPNGTSAMEDMKKEELASPTFWESAADAILIRRTVKSMDFQGPELDRVFDFKREPIEEANELLDLNSDKDQAHIQTDIIISDLESKLESES